MKKMMVLLALCAAAIAGCGPKTPEAVALKFMECQLKGDLDGAMKYMTKDGKKMIEGFKTMAGDKWKEEVKKDVEKHKGVKVAKKDVKIDGDKATVKITLSKEGEKETEEEEIKLIKEDGEWKVATGKEGKDLGDAMKEAVKIEPPKPASK